MVFEADVIKGYLSLTSDLELKMGKMLTASNR